MKTSMDISTLSYSTFDIEHSMSETEFWDAVINEDLRTLRVMETPVGFYVLIELEIAGTQKEWFMCTRRSRVIPKLYANLNRLNEHIKEFAPVSHFLILRNQPAPPGTKPKLSGAPSHKRRRAANTA